MVSRENVVTSAQSSVSSDDSKVVSSDRNDGTKKDRRKLFVILDKVNCANSIILPSVAFVRIKVVLDCSGNFIFRKLF